MADEHKPDEPMSVGISVSTDNRNGSSWRDADWKAKLPEAVIAFGAVLLTSLLGGIAYFATGQYKVPGTLTLLVDQSAATASSIQGIRRAIGRLHNETPAERQIVIEELVLDSPVKGLVSHWPPYQLDSQWYASVTLFDQKDMVRWDVPLSSAKDRRVIDVLEAAIKNQAVGAVTLDQVQPFVSVASSVDASWSFVARASVEVCRNRFSAADVFGPPTIVERWPESFPAATTGRQYIGLLNEREHSLRPQHNKSL